MTDAKTCPSCRAALPADATRGVCPACLLEAGLAGGGDAGDSGVPPIEELAPKFPGLAIESLVGRGGMGVVYRARHKALDRPVALKVLAAHVASDRAFADRFQREARALAKLQHPNIVAVHDFGLTDGLFWLVMEFVDGVNVREAMAAGQVGPDAALRIVPQICDALQYAHEHGVVHRDIKPENILLDRTGRVKVADFGLAKLTERGAADVSLTGVGQVMGTLHYMAPEQWERPKDVDHRADIYSLGVVFYEMLTGELPVGRFAAPSKKTDVDARIDEIVLKTLEREREARYQHADDVKTDVGRATSAAAPPPPPPAAPGARAHVGRWHWDSDEEKARGGRLSRLAVAGALASPIAMVAGALCALLAGDGWATFGVPVTIATVGWFASVISWARIQNSGDRLRGRAWAAAGTFLPLPLACIGGLLSFILTGTQAPEPPVGAPDPASVPGLMSPIDTREQLKDLWQGLQREHPRLASASTEAEHYYDRDSWVRISALPPGQRDLSGALGELGLPLAGENFLGESLLAFHGFRIAVDEETRTATLTAFSDRRTLVARARFAERGWRFTDDPVQVRAGVEGDTGAPPPGGFQLSSKLTEVISLTETPKILDLWQRLTVVVARRNIDAAYDLYLPSAAAELRAMTRNAIAKQVQGDPSQGGQLGLPFFAMLSSPREYLVGCRLTDASVVDIVTAADGTHVVRVSAWAGRPGSKLHFHLCGRMTGDGTARQIEWFFDKGHVNELR